jgi:ketosteroid isomerase-like protein
VSQENVEIVEAVLPPGDVDLVSLMRDDELWVVASEGVAPLMHPEFEIVGTVIGTERAYLGIAGFREFLLDWLAPWDTFRSRVEQTIDDGEHVVTIFRQSARRGGSELEATAAWVWTIKDGKVARIIGYADPGEALKAVGLEE